MSTLTIRFAGICCFLKPRPNEKDTFAMRVVLPVDRHADDPDRNDGTHIPYIEFDVVDNPRVDGRFAFQATYPRDLVVYRRLHLSGDRISILNAAPANGGNLRVLGTFDERIPSMSAVTPGLGYPDPEYFQQRPSTERVAAIFDIDSGDLHAGPSGIFPTKFSAPTDWPTRRLAMWAELQVPIRGNEKPVIVIESLGNAPFGRRTIELSETTDHITIGNQLLPDIQKGLLDTNPNAPPDSENFRAHFAMVYDLFPAVPANASRPDNGMTIRNGCIGTQIP